MGTTIQRGIPLLISRRVDLSDFMGIHRGLGIQNVHAGGGCGGRGVMRLEGECHLQVLFERLIEG